MQAKVVHQPCAERAHAALERRRALGALRRLIERGAAGKRRSEAEQGLQRLLLAGRDSDDDNVGLVVDPIERREERAVVPLLDKTQRVIAQGGRTIGRDSAADVVLGCARDNKAHALQQSAGNLRQTHLYVRISSTRTDMRHSTLQMWIGRLDRNITGIEGAEVPRSRHRAAVFRRLEIEVDEFVHGAAMQET